MNCDYCLGVIAQDEEGESEGYKVTGGDETLDLCESCHEHYYGKR